MPLTINWVNNNVPAIIEAWYPGQSGGLALAEVLVGKINPGGKLPVTFFKSVEDLPPLDDYDISKGRTYWFYEGQVLFPFGFGLSYTSFDFSNLQISNLSPSNNEIIEVSFDLTNVGNVGGYEVTQLYIRDLESSHVQLFKRLKKFYKCFIDVGEIKKITFELNAKILNTGIPTWKTGICSLDNLKFK